MKKLLSIFVFVLSAFIANAHYITPTDYCSATNKVSYNCTSWDIAQGNTAYFYVTKNGGSTISQSNPVVWSVIVNLSKFTTSGIGDSVGKITTSGFYINVPSKYNILYGWENENGQYNKIVWTSGTFDYTKLTNVCLALPINFSFFTGEYIAGELRFAWGTQQEANVSHYDIWQYVDSQYIKIATVPTKAVNGNSGTPLVYTCDVPVGNVILAGLSSGFGVLLLLGGLVSMKNRKFVPLSLMFFAVTLFSCSKNETKPVQITKNLIFQLREVDINGDTTLGTSVIVNNVQN